MANSNLARTNGTSTNQKIGTFSAWVKRSGLSAGQGMISGYVDSNNYSVIYFDSSDRLAYLEQQSGSTESFVRTTRLFRDTNAWYHIVVALDATQSTSSNRVKLYVNGSQETDLSSTNYPSDTNLKLLSNSTPIKVGEDTTGSPNYFNGYMSHIAFVDGTALTPTSFGETDSTSGIWKFKSPSGVTWGTNGFHLKFENSGALGTDSSGNSNTFTVNGNLKQAVDTPSNVYATINGANTGPYIAGTLSNGNLSHTGISAGNYYTPGSTLRVSSGKWYAEFKCQAATNWTYVGVDTRNLTATGDWIGKTATGWGYLGGSSAGGSNSLNHNNSQSSYGDTYGTGDIIGIALDLDNKKLYFSKNGTYQNSGVPTSGSTGTGAVDISTIGDDVYFGASNWSGSYTAGWDFNFGNGFFGTTSITSAGSNGNGSLFEYNVPSGYYALNTKNINTYG